MEDKETKIDQVSIDGPHNAGPACATRNDADDDQTNNPTGEIDCAAQIDALVAEVKDLNDKYLRAHAEIENTRRRAALDCESTARHRAMGVAKNFLPVMDAIEAALTHAPDDAGIQSMHRAMTAAFDQVGIEKIESIGATLNPALHNAIQVIESPDVTSGTIVQEMQRGYKFGDNILRTAMVVVAK